MAKLTLFERRRQRVRTSLRKRGGTRPRLSIDKDLRGKTGATVSGAQEVGRQLAERAKAAGVTQVVFDRGGFLFHGRVKALADAAREGGLEF
jgi:large subunit ribosomal protein L18